MLCTLPPYLVLNVPGVQHDNICCMLIGGVLRDSAMNEMADPDNNDGEILAAPAAPGGNNNNSGKPKQAKEKKAKTLEQQAQFVLFLVCSCLTTKARAHYWTSFGLMPH